MTRVKCAGDLIGLLELIYVFVSVSSLRPGKFVSLQRASSLPVLEIPKQSDTRWVCKLKALTLFKIRLRQVLDLLQFYAANGKPSERVEACGLLNQINFDTIFVLQVLQLLLPHTDSLSTILQGKSASMFQACTLVKATKQVVCSMKSYDSFESFVKAAVEQCILCSISVPTWAQSLALSSHGTTDQSHLQAGSEVPAQDIVGVSRVSNRSNRKPPQYLTD